MKIIKGLFFSFIAGLGLLLFGCEYANNIRTASFANITAYGSDKNTVRIAFEKDERVNDKYFDIQVRSSEAVDLNITEELRESLDVQITDTKWNSLATLFVNAKGEPNTESFEVYKKVQSKTYIITSEKEVTLTFRVVIGEAEKNSNGMGYILTNSKEVSDEFKLKLAKKESKINDLTYISKYDKIIKQRSNYEK